MKEYIEKLKQAANLRHIELYGDIAKSDFEDGYIEGYKAAQQAPEPVEELRNVLYKFRDLWCQNIDISTIDEFLEEYKS